jgi:hypothetical protein
MNIAVRSSPTEGAIWYTSQAGLLEKKVMWQIGYAHPRSMIAHMQ